MGGPRTVSGFVRLREALGPGRALLEVRIEDVSRADAAAPLVARTSIQVTGPLPAGTSIPFALLVPGVDETAHYSVRVHLAMSDPADVKPGDRISTQSYPVLTRGHSDVVEVEARKI